MNPQSKTNVAHGYRADIDGLRAIAVLSVILFHLNEQILPGGFVGVDIFFVISGYLISLHILKDLELGTFTLAEFYRKRIKRIAPVMLVVIATVLVLSLVLQRPEDSEQVARSGFASIFSMANVYFWLFLDKSYFAAGSNQIPLLHLWSLGVEEQYYIFWPLVLLALGKRIRGMTFVVLFSIIAAASFILGEYLHSIDANFSYYMLPTRAGELLAGALTAYLVIKKGHRSLPEKFAGPIALLGLTCIFSSLFLLSEDQVFPGFRAIPSTLGAAMVILAGHSVKTLISRILSFRPFVLIGLISYSAYLWHWPLIAFTNYADIKINLVNGCIIFALTIFLAFLSYNYIEKPTRQYNGSALKVFTYQFAMPATVIVVLTVVVMKTDGFFPHHNADQYRSVADKTLPAYRYDYVCQAWELNSEHLVKNRCVLGEAGENKPSVLLWGDSNAAQFVGMLGVFAREEKFQFKNLAHSACPPIFSDPAEYAQPQHLTECRNSLALMKGVVTQYDVVIISSSWTYYERKSSTFLDSFMSTVDSIASQGKLVILIGKIPTVSGYDRLCMEKAIGLPFLHCSKVKPSAAPKKILAFNTTLSAYASTHNHIEYFDISDELCSDGVCSAYDENGEVLYFDSSHLSLPASWKLGERIVAQRGVPYPFTLINKRAH